MTGTETKGGSWPLSDIAEVKMRGGDIPEPGSREEELIFAAWHVYEYISAKARREGKPAVRFGMDGWEWEGEIPQAVRVLWPAGASPLPLSELKHDAARARLVTWLCTSKTLANVVQGREESRVRNGGTIRGTASRWWVSSEFQGPEGMRLPDRAVQEAAAFVQPPEADAESVRVVIDTPEGKKTAVAQVVKDWWCPFISKSCKHDIPMTRPGLDTHLLTVHRIGKNTGLYEIAIDDAKEIRGLKGADEQEPAPPQGDGEDARDQVHVSQPPPVSPAAPVPVSRPAIPLAPSPAPVSLTGFAAQARVFALQVAELEAERDALLRRVTELEEQLRKAQAEQQFRIDDSTARVIARHVASMVRSGNGSEQN